MNEISPNKFVQRLKPYKPSERVPQNHDNSALLKLDWNEATRTPSAAVTLALIKYLQQENLSSYPDISNDKLIRLLAEYSSVDEQQVQFFGGSDEGLNYIARTFLSSDDVVVSLSPNYDNFRVYAEACGAYFVERFYDNPFDPGINRFLETSLSPQIVYISNPNNPMGTLLSETQISLIATKFSRSLIVVDEAYYEFSGVTAVRLLSDHPNIVISRTFSKAFGLAGVRFGYLIARKDILSSINRIRNSKNISLLAQIAAVAALEDVDSMRTYVSEVEKNRESTVKWLKKEKKIVRNSAGNYIMIQTNSPREFVNSMLRAGTIVRDRSSMPLLEGYVRVTIGGHDCHRSLEKALNKNLALIRDVR